MLPKPRYIFVIFTILLLAFSSILPGYANTLENKIRETEQELGTIQDRL
ncbi:MAG: hypothetical protein GX996_10735, partial [Firmicutes bacterium]|nr:hypothetical protein [Bacillota bacterium]